MEKQDNSDKGSMKKSVQEELMEGTHFTERFEGGKKGQFMANNWKTIQSVLGSLSDMKQRNR